MTEETFVLEPGRISLATRRRIERDGAAIALAPECRDAAGQAGPFERHHRTWRSHADKLKVIPAPTTRTACRRGKIRGSRLSHARRPILL
jgi:hypothetical protein